MSTLGRAATRGAGAAGAGLGGGAGFYNKVHVNQCSKPLVCYC